ncbi:hypothetical protein G4B88_027366 [Cannabis sativa]|uniref:Uncharacterized protein n=1 Tax=Cannabis sativa TaxID=3483 RepID=A0A7J6HQS8_CANSA|nr:hypothetical protein G4B88_027366 [Cannabis sativa]
MCSTTKDQKMSVMRRTRRRGGRRIKPRSRGCVARRSCNNGGGTCSKVADKLEALKNLIPTHEEETVKPEQLFQQTADYIVLLRTQVVILQKLVDFYGSGEAENTKKKERVTMQKAIKMNNVETFLVALIGIDKDTKCTDIVCKWYSKSVKKKDVTVKLTGVSGSLAITLLLSFVWLSLALVVEVLVVWLWHSVFLNDSDKFTGQSRNPMCKSQYLWASLKHFLVPFERVKLLHTYLLMKPCDEQVCNMVNLIFQLERLTSFFLFCIPYHINHRPSFENIMSRALAAFVLLFALLPNELNKDIICFKTIEALFDHIQNKLDGIGMRGKIVFDEFGPQKRKEGLIILDIYVENNIKREILGLGSCMGRKGKHFIKLGKKRRFGRGTLLQNKPLDLWREMKAPIPSVFRK